MSNRPTPSSKERSQSGRIVGRQPSPRVLIIIEDDELAEGIADLFPTSKRIKTVLEVREDEYDIVVATEPIEYRQTYGSSGVPADHLFLVTFGVAELGQVLGRDRREGEDESLRYWSRSIAREYEIPAEVDPLFQRLIEDDLLPAVVARTDRHPILDTGVPLGSLDDLCVYPLLKTTEGAFLSALFVRPGKGVGLALPSDVKKHVEWVKSALRVFRKLAPERFKQIPGWEEEHAWSTATEQGLRREIAALVEKRETLVAGLDRRENHLRSELADASAKADDGLRRLLTSQGESLVEGVLQSLRGLGFDATPMDPRADPSNKLEDLRVTDPSNSAWEALVEVRGYRGGASLTDLFRTQRFVERYRGERRERPSAVWYIVNQFAGQDPAVRQPVLSSQEAELEEWAAINSGLAVDTADLFRLVTDVEADRLTTEEARRSLQDSRVRFTYFPTSDADDAPST